MQFHSRYWRSSSQINHSKSTENSNKSNSVNTRRPPSTAEVWTFFASITYADKRHNACWAYMRNMQFKVGDFTKFSVASRNIAPLGHLRPLQVYFDGKKTNMIPNWAFFDYRLSGIKTFPVAHRFRHKGILFFLRTEIFQHFTLLTKSKNLPIIHHHISLGKFQKPAIWLQIKSLQ